jgi:hypothetical protein
MIYVVGRQLLNQLSFEFGVIAPYTMEVALLHAELEIGKTYGLPNYFFGRSNKITVHHFYFWTAKVVSLGYENRD